MSDLIPFDIQEEIMKRLPVKSLIQFRSVSKAWKTLIDSTEFITRHSLHQHTHPHRLMVLYVDHDYNYLTFLDDQSFPQHRSVPAIPPSLERLNSPRLVGSSHGLLCLYGLYSYYTFADRKAVIWNPSIRKAIVPNVTFSTKSPVIIGFGVSPVTGDPTIVEFFRDDNRRTVVRVFKLSTGNWTDQSNNLPKRVYDVTWYQAVVDKFIYWFAHIWVSRKTCNVILSFDMTNDKFGEVELPKRLAFKAHKHWEISKVRESLGVLEYSRRKHVCDVWVMENDGAFKKLFTIKEPNEEIQIVGFNKSDCPILEMGYESEDPEKAQLSVYDPSSKQIKDLEINGEEELFNVNTYTETLLLLDQPEL